MAMPVDPVEKRAGQAAFHGALIGFFLAFVGVALSTWAVFDLQPGSALALGVFIGFWGGIGFGVMIGGCTVLAREMDHPAPDVPPIPHDV
ncbi:MAG: hypothetical protein KDB02_03050 [Acidimicrobiales bacterium]|nr:hypothetical protein [Acidimicrobiales bacterium]